MLDNFFSNNKSKLLYFLQKHPSGGVQIFHKIPRQIPTMEFFIWYIWSSLFDKLHSVEGYFL